MIERRSYDDGDVTRLVAEVQQEYVGMYGGPDEAAIDVSEFAPPAGVMLVGVLEGVAVATGGWRLLQPGVAEVKRMYVVPAARRRGLARRMLHALEADAASAGVVDLVLNTGPVQTAAIALYRDEGYEPRPPFGHYAAYGEAVFLGRPLAAGVRADEPRDATRARPA